jgi:hypothetical protein
MNTGAISRTALRAVQDESIENKILVSKKIIIEIQNTPSEASVRLAADLRKILKSVTKDADASAEQIHEAGALLTRIVDPRRRRGQDPETALRSTERLPKFDEDGWLEDKKLKTPETIPDGFDRSINANEAVARVAGKYGSQQPSWTDVRHQEVLQIALGETLLDERSVVQLYLGLAYDFVERLKCNEAEVPPQSRWLSASICAYALKQGIRVPTPNCFTNPFDELKFRA